MAKRLNKITIQIEPKYFISFWDAIKLRIAGTNYKPIVEKILKQLEIEFNKQKE